MSERPNPERFRDILATLRPRRSTAPTIVSIIKATAAAHDLTPEEMLSHSRATETCHARQIAMTLAVEMSGAPKSAIAQRFRRDRSCIEHAVKVVLSRRDQGVFNAMDAIRAEVTR